VRAPGNADTLFMLGATPRIFKLFVSSPFAATAFEYKVDWIDTTQGTFDTIPGAFHSVATTQLAVDPQSEPRA
jgi:hypothetical protein